MTYPLSPFAHIPKWREDMRQADEAEARMRSENWRAYDRARGHFDLVRPFFGFQAAAFNVVKQDAGDTVFGSQDPTGALISSPGAEQEIWVHFAQSSTIGAIEGCLFSVTNFRATNTTGSDNILTAFLRVFWADIDWDPGSLTYNNKPAIFSTGSGTLLAINAPTITGSGTVTQSMTASSGSATLDKAVLRVNEIGSTPIFGMQIWLDVGANTRIDVDDLHTVRIFKTP